MSSWIREDSTSWLRASWRLSTTSFAPTTSWCCASRRIYRSKRLGEGEFVYIPDWVPNLRRHANQSSNFEPLIGSTPSLSSRDGIGKVLQGGKLGWHCSKIGSR
ncbi:hypothetical protein AC579_5256 [Pseudocercospora musae]|uniref:Uncharacterized protein n=1 Tax=Pseudocercospora musae TaxID=113226 RepID=A0A139IPJ7_9PEZI|nr:hypothetical protein AC579_5256 [Pseudocercospora musae]